MTYRGTVERTLWNIVVFSVDAQDALAMSQENKLSYLSHLVLAAIRQICHDLKKKKKTYLSDHCDNVQIIIE